MKKILSIILAFAMIFVLVACGKSKVPEGFDQALYDYATAAYELVRDYNLGKISKDDADQRADAISKNVNSLPVPKNDTKMSDDTFRLTYETHKLSVVVNLSSFSWKIVSGGSTVDIEESLKELIDGK